MPFLQGMRVVLFAPNFIFMTQVSPWGRVLCGVFGVFTWQNTQKSEQYALVQENLQQQIDDEEENQKAIEEQAEYQKTDAYIEDLAREKLGLVHEDEIIFKKK